MNPQYPIYIPSKGRAKTPMTATALRRMGVPFKVVVEPPEFDEYAAALGADSLLVLPFHDLGQGSIPARNWIWEHAIAAGAKRHWIMDDNIRDFYRLNFNRKIWVKSGTMLRAAEDFVDRYENVPIAGLNYQWFVAERDQAPPYYLNTRVYSCILIDNALDLRWRGRYNEDTDLCLRALKAGHVTVLFNAFLCNKMTTMKMAGGNTDTVYATNDHRLGFARSLEEQHPDVVKVTWRFHRWHHLVDYSPFRKNRLRRRADVVPTVGPNEYGMTLRRVPIAEAEERGRLEDVPEPAVEAAPPPGCTCPYSEKDPDAMCTDLCRCVACHPERWATPAAPAGLLPETLAALADAQAESLALGIPTQEAPPEPVDEPDPPVDPSVVEPELAPVVSLPEAAPDLWQPGESDVAPEPLEIAGRNEVPAQPPLPWDDDYPELPL